MSGIVSNLLKKLNVFGSKDPQLEFLIGKDYLAKGNYKKALHHFKEAYKSFKDESSRVSALENAIIASTRLKDPNEVFSLSYQLARLIAKNFSVDAMKLQPYLEQARQAALQLKAASPSFDKLGEVTVLTFLAHLASMEFQNCRSLLEKSRVYLSNNDDESLKYMEEALKILSSEESLIRNWRFPSISVPREFHRLVERAEAVARAHANLRIELQADPSFVPVGKKLQVRVTLRAQSPLMITNVELEHLPRGLRMVASKAPSSSFKLEQGESFDFHYTVFAQLEGTWLLGPVVVKYKIGDTSRYDGKQIDVEFVVKSKKVEVEVRSPSAQLHPNMRIYLEMVEEKRSLVLECSLKNDGERIIENLEIFIDHPTELELIEGTVSKRIFELHPREEYAFTLRFIPKNGIPLSTLSGKKIKLRASASDDVNVESTLMITDDIFIELEDENDK